MITERKHDKWNVTKNMTSKNCHGGFEGKERANGKYILTKHQCIKCPTQHAWIREQYDVNTMQFGQVDGCRRRTNEIKEQNMLQIKHMHKTCKKENVWNHSYQLHIHQQVCNYISISYWPSYIQAVSFKHLFFCTLLHNYIHSFGINYHHLSTHIITPLNIVCLQMLIIIMNENKRKYDGLFTVFYK